MKEYEIDDGEIVGYELPKKVPERVSSEANGTCLICMGDMYVNPLRATRKKNVIDFNICEDCYCSKNSNEAQ